MNLLVVLIVISIINVLSFIVYGLDKLFAVKGKWRIREITLLGLSVLGGGVGSLIAMLLFKHKLSKSYFRMIIPFTIIAYWCALLYWVWKM